MSNEDRLKSYIRTLSGLRYRWLAFSPTLEQVFQSESESFRSRRMWLEGLIGIGLYLVYSALRGIAAPEQAQHGLVLRFGVVVPLSLAVNLAVMFRLPLWLHETSILCASCVAGSVELILEFASAHPQEASFQLAIVAVLVFTNTVMRLRTTYAVAALTWALGAEWMSWPRANHADAKAQVIGTGMVLAICALTITANYSIEREARLAFLRQAQKQQVIGSLSLTNETLATAAFTDALTGLANRAALDDHLQKLWPEMIRSRVICSAIVVDIDHFKFLNDRYGHLYGDRVLKRIARLLAESLRGEDDFIARFGGEEFVVLLPRTPVHLAFLVAERLRRLVELAGLPSLCSGDPSLEGIRATISCGVATTFPPFYPDPYALIGAADQALYRAKRDGRNLVKGSSVPGELSRVGAGLVYEVWDNADH